MTATSELTDGALRSRLDLARFKLGYAKTAYQREKCIREIEDLIAEHERRGLNNGQARSQS